MKPIDEDNRRLGELVRELARLHKRVTVEDMGDDGCFVVVGRERQRSDGASIDTAIDLASKRAGIMRKASIPARCEMPTLPDDYRHVRGPA